MIKKISIVIALFSALFMPFAQAQSGTVADNSTITYRVKSLAGPVNGSVSGLKGKITFDPANLQSSSIDVSVDPATIKSGLSLRDKDLKNEAVWFDVVKYPAATFKSTSVTKTATGYLADGTITLKGKDHKIQVAFTQSNDTYTGSFKINRLDYGIGKSSGLVKDDVEITFNITVKK